MRARAGTRWAVAAMLAASLRAPALAEPAFTQIGTLPDSYYAHRTDAATRAVSCPWRVVTGSVFINSCSAAR